MMYFIDKGVVEVLSYDERQVMVKLKPGQYFGEWSLISSEPRTATVRAATNCDLYILQKKDLDDVMKYFPDVYEEIVRTAYSEKHSVFESVSIHPDGHSVHREFADRESALLKMYREYIEEEKVRSTASEFPTQSMLARIKDRVMGIVARIPETLVRLHNKTADPESKLCSVIQYICCSFTIASFWSTTYMLALGTKECAEYIVCEICEIVLIIQIFFKFHIRYYDENGTYIYHYNAVSRHYLKTKLGFLFDMVCSFPIGSYTISSLDEEDISESLWFLSKVNIIHILRMVHVLLFIYGEEKNISINLALIRMFKCIVLLIVYFHASALLFIYTACPDFCYLDSWLSFIPMFSESKPPGETVNWTLSDIYINALYWVISRLTITGYGTVRNRWIREIWLTIVVMFVAKFVVGYIQGIFSATEANAYALQVAFEEKLQAVKTYMVEKKVPAPLQERVIQYYNYLFARTRGVDYSTLFEDTPKCMKTEIFGSIGLNLLKKQRLFSNLPENFLQHLSTALKLQSFPAGEYLIQKGDSISKMFLIVNGKVIVSKQTADGRTRETFLTNGQAYGVRFLFTRGHVEESLQADNYVNILKLSKNDFQDIFSNYEEIQEIIEDRRQSLFSNTKKE